MIFLMWYDDKPKTTMATKIADACAAFHARFGVSANVALVPLDSPVEPVPGIDVRTAATIGKGMVWVGRE